MIITCLLRHNTYIRPRNKDHKPCLFACKMFTLQKKMNRKIKLNKIKEFLVDLLFFFFRICLKTSMLLVLYVKVIHQIQGQTLVYNGYIYDHYVTWPRSSSKGAVFRIAVTEILKTCLVLFKMHMPLRSDKPRHCALIVICL